ncbi:hypothetical protein O181_030147 [Austropuccinia psidii MF-1]|uniref:Uncharacterized protein n=1 Tax=Austropuccinia psidii MF-1 TaxID=1389203 RepID=A0A9Q3CV66_9BASI|nr:hypothetical protein [Austropuccinia psidii MF-1]
MDGILDSYARKIVHHFSPLPELCNTTIAQGDTIVDKTEFRLTIGSLAYLKGGLHPNISFSVNYLERHSIGPTKRQWAWLDHLGVSRKDKVTWSDTMAKVPLAKPLE